LLILLGLSLDQRAFAIIGCFSLIFSCRIFPDLICYIGKVFRIFPIHWYQG